MGVSTIYAYKSHDFFQKNRLYSLSDAPSHQYIYKLAKEIGININFRSHRNKWRYRNVLNPKGRNYFQL